MNPGVDASTEAFEVDLPDEAATVALACTLAPLLTASDVVALVGDLGTGKTTLARALINALPRDGGARTGDGRKRGTPRGGT